MANPDFMDNCFWIFLFKNLFFRHCEWIQELVLELHFTQTLRMYWRKMDPEVPPEVDDGSTEDMRTGRIDDKEKVFFEFKLWMFNF